MKTTASRAATCVVFALMTISAGRAQSGEPPTFEVASVRLTAPKTRASERITDTSVTLTNISLRQLLWMAFRINPFYEADLISVPGWSREVSVDLLATLPAGATRDQVPDMMRNLLVTRFGLETRVESVPTDVYVLAVGNAGIRMQEVEASNELETEFVPTAGTTSVPRDSTSETVGGRRRIISSLGSSMTITERTRYAQNNTSRGTHELDATRITMPEFAALLATGLGRPVLDRTGLGGVYRFTVEIPLPAFVGNILPMTGATRSEPSGVSASSAAERLGLRLERQRMPIDHVVVEKLERAPTPN
jgi:uncharacterized protein (TIGR03435 family)